MEVETLLASVYFNEFKFEIRGDKNVCRLILISKYNEKVEEYTSLTLDQAFELANTEFAVPHDMWDMY